MVQTLLIITLVIAIIFDVIRIVQYIAMRKVLDKKNKSDIADKIDDLYGKWVSLEDYKYTFGHYCMEQWYDEK